MNISPRPAQQNADVNDERGRKLARSDGYGEQIKSGGGFPEAHEKIAE
jgi:hypothetical protein